MEIVPSLSLKYAFPDQMMLDPVCITLLAKEHYQPQLQYLITCYVTQNMVEAVSISGVVQNYATVSKFYEIHFIYEVVKILRLIQDHKDGACSED